MPKQDSTSRVVLVEAIRYNLFYIIFSSFIARILSGYGYRVFILSNDFVLPHFDTQRSVPDGTVKNLLKKNTIVRIAIKTIFKFIFRFFITGNIKVIYYSRLLKESGAAKHAPPFTMTSYIDASHKRRFGGREYNPRNVRHEKYAKQSYKSENINRRIADILLKKYRPDLFFVLDGIYVTYGPLVEVFKKCGVHVLIYQLNGFHDRSLYIGENHFSVNSITEHWNDYIVKNYYKDYKEKVVQYMNRRVTFKDRVMSLEQQIEVEKLRERTSEYKKIIGIFPNLPWDGAIKERDNIFNGLLDWMKSTVEWIRRRKDYCLVFREHPLASWKYNEFESALALLRENVVDLGKIENLVIISALNPLSSYKIITDFLDASLVYNGTLCIEIAFMGYPVIIAGNSPYSGKGIAYEPATRDEYFDMIDSVSVNTPNFMKNKEDIIHKAEVAAAYQFFHNSFYCPIMPTVRDFYNNTGNKKYWASFDWSDNSMNPETSPRWKRTIKRMLFPFENN